VVISGGEVNIIGGLQERKKAFGCDWNQQLFYEQRVETGAGLVQ
jgi:hypothetical protein